MRPRLIVHLPADHAAPLRWIALDANGAVEAADTLEAAPPKAYRARPVIGLADGRAVLLTAASIPTQSRQRLLRALPFALEDQLADDVETLHFAPGTRDASGRVSVAVVAHRDMRAWLDRLADAGLDPDEIQPETLTLPRHEDAWTVLADAERFLVRSGAQAGFAGDTDNLAPLLTAALAEAGDAAPARLLVHHTPDITPALPADAPPVELVATDQPLGLLAAGLDPRGGIRLRQGAYGRTDAVRAHWRRWRTAVVLALAVLLAATGRAWLESWQLDRAVAAERERLIASFRQVFPDSGIPGNQLRTVMSSRLERLRRGSEDDGGGFLGVLARVAPALDDRRDVRLTALTFRAGTLEVELTADSLQSLDGLKQRLAATGGLSVEVRSAQADGERVRGRLVIGAAS